jgi:alkylation response protein AidB-like acyl-CoA dehydrogenase
MNFELSPEQEMLREMLQRFMTEKCGRDVVRAIVDGQDEWAAELWNAMQQLGLLGIGIDEILGGTGGCLMEVCLVAEALGHGLAPVPFVPTALVSQIIARFGNEHQRERLLPGIIAGGVRTTIAAIDGQFADGTISGTAPIVLDGAIADIALLATNTHLAIVPLDGPHVTRTPIGSVDRTRSIARLSLAAAPADALPDAALDWWQDAAAVLSGFEQLGGTERVIAMTRTHVLERRSFGRAIGSYQAVKHRLVDMHIKALIARAHAYHGAWALMTDAPERRLAAAGARVAASEAYRFSAREGLQLHGAMGTSWEHDAHLHLRRAEMLGLVWGGSRIWKERVVVQLEQAHV